MHHFPIGFVGGALASIFWAYNDFHQPYGIDAVRTGTTLRRYVLGLLIYTLGAFFVYYLLTQVYGLSFRSLFGEIVQPTDEQKVPDFVQTVANLSPGTIAVPLMIIMLANNLPILRDAVAVARKSAQSLAYYPHSINLTVALLSSVHYSVDSKADDHLSGVLGQFGIDYKTQSKNTCLVASILMAKEISSINIKIMTLCSNTRYKLARRFFFSQVDAREHELAYARFLRHLSYCMSAELALQGTQSGLRALGNLSTLINDEGEKILLYYRHLIARAALSTTIGSKARGRFLQSLGYATPLEVGLPFWPILLSFVAVFLGMVTQQGAIYYLRPGLVARAFDLHTKQGFVNLAMIMLNQSLTQSLGVLWAVAPKFRWLSAQPSLRAFPVKSYVLFGTMAYITSFGLFMIMYIANPPLPFAVVPLRASAILSIVPMLYCVVIAYLTDVHIMKGRELKGTDRILDGFVVAATVMLGQFVVVNLVACLIAPAAGITMLRYPVSVWLSDRPLDLLNFMKSILSVLELIVPFVCVGFVIGATVPLTAAQALIREQRVRIDGLPKLPPSADLVGKPPPRAVINLPRK